MDEPLNWAVCIWSRMAVGGWLWLRTTKSGKVVRIARMLRRRVICDDGWCLGFGGHIIRDFLFIRLSTVFIFSSCVDFRWTYQRILLKVCIWKNFNRISSYEFFEKGPYFIIFQNETLLLLLDYNNLAIIHSL